jgi:hypothetical protein
MSDKIPGVPDGWELVRIGVPIRDVDWIIGPDGEAMLCYWDSTDSYWVIIRKIERPARYRPFANAEEHLPHWGKPIRVKGGIGFDSVVSTSMVGIYVAAGTMIVRYSMADAFQRFEFADGTPFGVKIDE